MVAKSLSGMRGQLEIYYSRETGLNFIGSFERKI